MAPFNTLFCITFAAFILILIVVSLIMRKRSDKAKRALIAITAILTFIGFFVYKYFISIDKEYDAITQNMGGFNWWGELPLHLCNINLILIPIAVITMKKPLLSFCFFVAPIGALMALLMPANGFSGYSILLPRMIGFYGIHFIIIVMALSIVTFGLYRPKFRDLPLTLVTLLLVALVVFGINMLFRATGLHPKANYFFSVETEGNFLLEIFHKWIPVPFLYLLPSVLILAPYMLLITLGFFIADKVKAHKKA
jgi:uncharacterized membrane protein YwaF